jgi:hypothetical protein
LYTNNQGLTDYEKGTNFEAWERPIGENDCEIRIDQDKYSLKNNEDEKIFTNGGGIINCFTVCSKICSFALGVKQWD